MRIQAINNNCLNTRFNGKFEQSEELDLIMNSSNEKDLAEFSLVLDTINNTPDKMCYYVRKKQETFSNPASGFDLGAQENWDSFPKKYKTVIVENFEESKFGKVLKEFTNTLKVSYNIHFNKEELQRQISKKLAK